MPVPCTFGGEEGIECAFDFFGREVDAPIPVVVQQNSPHHRPRNSAAVDEDKQGQRGSQQAVPPSLLDC
jgi:hypothetical protein